jgi:hypothetical protein
VCITPTYLLFLFFAHLFRPPPHFPHSHYNTQYHKKTKRFEGAGYSLAGTREVLSNIASDIMVDRGDCVNAVEIFWTPSERKEVLTRQDVIIDFPELIDL